MLIRLLALLIMSTSCSLSAMKEEKTKKPHATKQSYNVRRRHAERDRALFIRKRSEAQVWQKEKLCALSKAIMDDHLNKNNLQPTIAELDALATAFEGARAQLIEQVYDDSEQKTVDSQAEFNLRLKSLRNLNLKYQITLVRMFSPISSRQLDEIVKELTPEMKEFSANIRAKEAKEPLSRQ